jgi:myo-inositol-1(or 4)-monophosphatase
MTREAATFPGYDLHALTASALRIAADAATVHREGFGCLHAIETKTSPTDVVSDVDRAAERVIVRAIKEVRPGDAILSEESTEQPGTSGVRWVIDPLDGTTNYVYRYPAFAVSIGIEIEGRPAIGVVHDSCHDHVYVGVVGQGATCDGQPMCVSTTAELSMALLATGFSPHAEVRARQALVLAQVLPKVRDMRRSGSPVLDLCAVAAGQVDGFYEVGLGRWDIAAGRVIAEAAGATLTVLPARTSPDPLVVAANPTLLPLLLVLLGEAGVIRS